jgi:dTDP-glucose 4,6-dehydratase
MKVLVTGGAGFIGSNFIRHLLAERLEAEVVNLDLLTYAGNLANLEDVSVDLRYRFVRGDVCDAGLVDDVMKHIDVVINFAAESHVDRSIAVDTPFVRTNVVGTGVLLSAALRHGVGRFVQISTDEVYGDLPWRDPEIERGGGRRAPQADSGSDGAPRFTEETPMAPRSPYAATKAAADHLVQAYHVTHGLDTVITRCSNNYGPYQFPEKLIPLMISRALVDRPLPVYGDGLHVRDWIHVLDHCSGILAAVEHGRPGQVYNFGGDTERTNLSVVRSLLGILGKPEVLIEHVDDRPGHDRRYSIDHARATQELGWRPKRSFEDGLADTVQWYLENEAWTTAVAER